MSTAVFTLLIATSQLALGVQAFERISPQVAAEQASRCGLGPVTIRYDDLLQSKILTARKATTATDEQLSCADRAASYYDLELPDPVRARYEAIRSERSTLLASSEARQWLADRGLLAHAPKYEKGITDDAVFTHNAEKLCGPRASGAFQTLYGPHVVSPDWIERELRPGNFDNKAFACLMNVSRAAGYELGFIGNEAAKTEPSGTKR